MERFEIRRFRTHHLSNRRHGFTLIELLVVVAIVVVLMAILLPALSSARESARTVACLSNQRQLGVAFNVYAQNFGQHLPHLENSDWFKDEDSGGIYSYISADQYWWERYPAFKGTILCCPTNMADGFAGNSYGLNEVAWYWRRGGTFVSDGWHLSLPIADKSFPSATALLMDSQQPSTRFSHPDPSFYPDFRHGNARYHINVLYFDWHAETLSNGQVPRNEYDTFWMGN